MRSMDMESKQSEIGTIPVAAIMLTMVLLGAGALEILNAGRPDPLKDPVFLLRPGPERLWISAAYAGLLLTGGALMLSFSRWSFDLAGIAVLFGVVLNALTPLIRLDFLELLEADLLTLMLRQAPISVAAAFLYFGMLLRPRFAARFGIARDELGVRFRRHLAVSITLFLVMAVIPPFALH